MIELITEVIVAKEPEVHFNNKGMHPGVVNGRRVYDKVNTSERRSRARLERAIEGWDRHIEQNPRDAMAIRSRGNCRDRLNGLG